MLLDSTCWPWKGLVGHLSEPTCWPWGGLVGRWSEPSSLLAPTLEMSHIIDGALGFPCSIWAVPRMMTLPNCMSAFDSFSTQLVFRLGNYNCFLAVEKIYFWTPINPLPHFSNSSYIASCQCWAVLTAGQRCEWHFADVMNTTYCSSITL